MNTLTKRACLLAGVVLAILISCVLVLVLRRNATEENTTYLACIYQDGLLLQTIPLDQVQETYAFSLEATDGGSNTIEISPGGIAITQADCPDQICVRQGRITNSLLPITCLPHRLVIELRSADTSADELPDALAY